MNSPLALIVVMSVMTILLRFLPFILFTKSTPKSILYLGNVLPYAIMAMLVVYCLKGINLFVYPFGLSEIIAAIVVILLHKLKHNTLLSILGGTCCYMFLVQVIF